MTRDLRPVTPVMAEVVLLAEPQEQVALVEVVVTPLEEAVTAVTAVTAMPATAEVAGAAPETVEVEALQVEADTSQAQPPTRILPALVPLLERRARRASQARRRGPVGRAP